MPHSSRSTAAIVATVLARSAGVASVASLLFASSCASTPMFAGRKAKRPDTMPLTDVATGKALPSYADRLEAAKQAQKQIPAAGEAKVQQAVVDEQHLASRVEQMSHEQPAVEPVRVAATTDRPWAPDLNGQPTVAPLNDAAIVAQLCPPRSILADSCPPCGSNAGLPVIAPATPRPFPTENGRDEYVCDGGDKGLPIHYEGGQIAGLEAEDTVAEFSDGQGNQRVTVSNQVCVYAPRFGVARAVSEAIEKFTIDSASGTHDGVTVAGYVHRAALDEGKDIASPVGMKHSDALSQMRSRQTDGELENDVAAASHVKLVNPFEDYGFVQDGLIRHAEKAVLFEAAKSAGEWSVGQGTKAIAQDLAGAEVIAIFNVEELVGVEDMRTPGDLRIVKLADKKTARPGDIVTFTIRFDNQGGKELYKIRILDNLSPRLQLIDESVTCDVAGELEIADSAQGGEVLTFRVNEALAGQTGGSLTFQCRIR
ncbi:hypothetical protein Pan44_49690 [Caulifigura coniformis]|uniref:DUF11 domain-containing protein n=1 Tax=Caulifigura coniformis TaxID=2527983 RepID=A0A517SLB2_9PLAN|nr:DUF11 domain-containing protein [Caulifigura coniformis]QDT56907.1 hypothetical protein Pan44_49690 [Caulifigura coniformis]